MLLLLATTSLGTRFLVIQTLATSTCSGAFNAPCAIGTTHRLVDVLAADLEGAADASMVDRILGIVTLGAAPYAEDIDTQ